MSDELTLCDVLDYEQEMEQQAAEEFAFKVDSCSYDLGYISQQVYLCLDCLPGKGVCYSCHISVLLC